MLAALVTIPTEFALRLVSIEPGFIDGKMKNEILPSVTVHVLDMPAVRWLTATTIADDLGCTKSISNILAGRIKRVGLKNSNADYTVAARINRVVVTAGLDVNR